MLSEKSDIAPDKLLGQQVDEKIVQRDGSTRHFNGFVSRFGQGRHQGRYFGYQATVSPWLWFLTRTTDCRIFQELTVPDIERVRAHLAGLHLAGEAGWRAALDELGDGSPAAVFVAAYAAFASRQVD